MTLQQKIWDKEHKVSSALPSMASDKPSSGVVSFFKYLKKHQIIPPKKIVDIGSGKGRNSIFLANKGFKVYAIDFIKLAVDHSRREAKKKGVSSDIIFSVARIDKEWPYKNDFFDLAVDCFSSIDIETREGRVIYLEEMLRTLKPGGIAMVSVVSSEDEWESKLIKESPGSEKNSTIWPNNGKFQKDYDEDELRDFYKDFEILKFKKINKTAFKLGKKYKATNFWLVLKKHQ